MNKRNLPVAAVEVVNVYVIKEQIQIIIVGIILDLMPIGIPEVSSYTQVLYHIYSVSIGIQNLSKLSCQGKL